MQRENGEVLLQIKQCRAVSVRLNKHGPWPVTTVRNACIDNGAAIPLSAEGGDRLHLQAAAPLCSVDEWLAASWTLQSECAQIFDAVNSIDRESKYSGSRMGMHPMMLS
mmetsp:Transcript_55413/g.115969  ORF Transcript_55413/g.115969 Transcript_55413/m.115969 type:complete len:109 (-) Transcript_55413:436-762(-)